MLGKIRNLQITSELEDAKKTVFGLGFRIGGLNPNAISFVGFEIQWFVGTKDLPVESNVDFARGGSFCHIKNIITLHIHEPNRDGRGKCGCYDAALTSTKISL